ncbi:MAG TPA: hypothetical protein VNF47_21310 [Streptosporangiaceae bacterium]|nr:hypothetical protein [Streptosporangiaceae bacterium]
MIPAGRSQDGQPASPDPAAPERASAAQPPKAPDGAESARGTEARTATVVASPDAEDGTAGDRSGHREPGAASQTAAVTDPVPAGQARGAPGGTVSGGLRGVGAAFRRAYSRARVRHATLLLAYLAAGIGATWPRFTYLPDGKLPKTPDASSFVWGLWWVAHQVAHLGNPFFTTYMAAPVGTQLGFSTMMPLAGFVLTPITWVFGPSASFTLLTILVPGLLCYAMFRAARLWLNAPGAIAAGGFFGLSSMLLWQDWYHVNIAAGAIFLPATVEAAVRLRRKPGYRPALALGIVLGASVMISQESTAVAGLLAAAILIPWLVGKLITDRASLRQAAWPVLVAAGTALVVASPQLIAMAQQILSGGASVPRGPIALNYSQFGVPLTTLFAPSPRLAYFGLGHLASAYSYSTSVQPGEGLPTFGVVLGGLAVLGIVAGWRKSSTWGFLGLWLAGAALALGTSLVIGTNCQASNLRPGTVWGRSCHQYLPLLGNIHWSRIPGSTTWAPVKVSNLMPYSWLVRVPGLAGLREADRFALAGLIGAAMLAGLVVQWLSRRKITWPLIAVVIALGVLEAGWAGGTDGPPFVPTQTMPTHMPALDKALTRDHSNSIVLDVPFGLRGGLALTGSGISERALLLATHDGHPRSVSYTAWVPKTTIDAITAHPFYRLLMKYQNATADPTPAEFRVAAADLRTLHIGWVLEWRNMWWASGSLQRYYHLEAYLRDLGFERVQLVCLVPSTPGHLCGPGTHGQHERVWVLKYEPNLANLGK